MVHLTVQVMGDALAKFEVDVDVATTTCLDIKKLASDHTKHSVEYMSAIVGGHLIQSETKLIDLDLPKEASIFIMIKSSPNSSLLNQQQQQQQQHLSDSITPTGTPLSTSQTAPSLHSYLEKLLEYSHIPNSSFEQAAKAPLEEDIASEIIHAYQSLNDSIPRDIPSNHSLLKLDPLVDPLNGLELGPSKLVEFENQVCDYSNLEGVRKQFCSLLPNIENAHHSKFVKQMATLLEELITKLKGSRNLRVQNAILASQQKVVNPTYITQNGLSKDVPISNNKELKNRWDQLNEQKNKTSQLVGQINRDNLDAVGQQMQQAIDSTIACEKKLEEILQILDKLKTTYREFVSVQTEKNCIVSEILTYVESYMQLEQKLESENTKLKQNMVDMINRYKANKQRVTERVNEVNAKAAKLKHEQNILIASMNILANMYLEHEMKRRALEEESNRVSSQGYELEDQKDVFEKKGTVHQSRLDLAIQDTRVACDVMKKFKIGIESQFGSLQDWVDASKSEHKQEETKALKEMYDSAMIQHGLATEVYDSASSSVTFCTEELAKLEQEIGLASSSRNGPAVKVKQASKDLLSLELPEYEKTRNEAQQVLEKLEKQVFTGINKRMIALGMDPLEVPSYQNNNTPAS